MEERQAIVQKTHDTYALVRQLEERVRVAEANVREMGEMIGVIDELKAHIGRLKARIDQLEAMAEVARALAARPPVYRQNVFDPIIPKKRGRPRKDGLTLEKLSVERDPNNGMGIDI